MFELRVNNEKVWSSQRQVTRVSLQSARGEIGAAGISPQDGVIDVFIEEVAPGGPVRLDQVEENQRQAIADTPEGLSTGQPDYSPGADANKPSQGIAPHGEDIPPGGPDVSVSVETTPEEETPGDGSPEGESSGFTLS